MTRVQAFDLALGTTGLASGVVRPPDEPNGDPAISVTVDKVRSTKTGMERLSELRRKMLTAAENPTPADLVMIEGYAFSAGGAPKKGAGTPSHAHALGELGGVVRLTLFERGFLVVDVPPASLKLYACGKGNAPKEQVMMDAGRRLGYGGHDNNEADALWLLAMGLDYLGYPLVVMPDHNRTALGKIAWPAGLRALHVEPG